MYSQTQIEKYISLFGFSGSMGNIRSSHIKHTARELVNTYSDKFSGDFENNKEMVSRFTEVQTKRLRNMLAGYVTRYWKIKMKKEKEF